MSWSSGVSGGSGGAPSGAAGGDLAGTYPNPDLGSGVIVNADVNAAAGIVKSKLASLGIVDADVAGGAAIAKAKLASLAIVNADVDPAAAIAKSKLASLGIVNADVDAAAAIAKTKLASLDVVNADVNAAAAIAYSKLNLTSGIVAGDLADLAVSARKATDLLRTGGWLPTGAIDQTYLDRIGSLTAASLTSGIPRIAGGLVIPGGRACTSITMMSAGTAGATLTNQWFALVDTSRNVLCTTLDDTSTAWAANTVKTLNIASAIGGGTPGTYTPTNAIECAVVIMVAATTPPNIQATASSATLAGLAPVISGNSSTSGLTTPASAPGTLGAITGSSPIMYAYVS